MEQTVEHDPDRLDHQLFKLLVESSHDWETWSGPDGELLYVSPSCERVTGYPPDRFTADRDLLFRIVEAEDRPMLKRHAAEVERGAAAASDIEFRIVSAEGGVRWVHHSCTPVFSPEGVFIGRRGSNRDVTAGRNSERALYRRLFEDAIEGIALEDPETGIVVDCNNAFLRLTGYERSEVVGRHQSFLHTREDGEKLPGSTFLRHVSEAAGETLSDRIVTRSGEVRDVDIRADFVQLSGRRFLQGFFRDITADRRRQREREITLAMMGLLNERNQTTELVRKVTACLREMLDFEAVGIRLRDGDDYPYFETAGFPAQFVRAESRLCALDENGEIERDAAGNPALACMCGNVLRGRFDPTRSFFTTHGSFWTSSTTRLLASGSEEDRQWRTRNRCNGEGYESVALIPLRHGGETLGLLQLNDHAPGRLDREIIALIENLADQVAIALSQRRAQEALAVSEQRFQDLTAAVGEFIWEVDAGGRITFVSDRVKDILGYAPGELVGKELSGLGAILGTANALSIVRGPRQGPRVFRNAEVQAAHKNGQKVWLLSTAVHRQGPAGEPTGLRGVSMDITERKRLAAELLQAQKMEAVGQLAGGIAHDFNNLLQVISGNLDNALLEVAPESAARADLVEAAKASEKASGLTSQLLAFSRRDVLAPVILDLNAVVSDVVKMLRRIVGEHIEVIVNAAPSPQAILADRGNILQVIMNLCVNARDAMPVGGTLTIVTESVVLGPADLPAPPMTPEGHYVVLGVRDDGEGMDDATRARIFEPFFTTKSPGRGTGLGLATVYGIVKAHGGFIDVESAPRQGTWFKIYFPTVESGTGEQQAGGVEAAAGGRETILVCEDDPAVLRYVTRLLGTSGYTVISAHDGQEGLQVFTERGGRIDLAVLDVMMPKLGGQALMERIRRANERVRFLFTTGYTDTAISADDTVRVLRKPYQRNELLRAVREILDEPFA